MFNHKIVWTHLLYPSKTFFTKNIFSPKNFCHLNTFFFFFLPKTNFFSSQKKFSTNFFLKQLIFFSNKRFSPTKSNCEKFQKFKLRHFKNSNGTKLKNSNCDITLKKTKILSKLNFLQHSNSNKLNLNSDKTQILKLW